MEASVAATPPQGAPTAPATPPASGGQGQQGGGTGQGSSSTGFNWGLFPGVPEGQRELLEPHLKDVQGYITKMEQQYSPYKGLMDHVPANQVQDMVGFLQQWGQDPLNTLIGLAQSLQSDGVINNPAFTPEALRSMLVAEQQQQGQGGEGQMNDPMVQQMAARLQQLEQAEQQRTAQAEQAEQQRQLSEAHAGMTATLVSAGIPQDSITPEMLSSQLIAHQGDVQAAVNTIIQFREGVLRGFTESNGSGPKPPTMVGGAPQAPKGGLRPNGRDAFRNASVQAEQALLMGAQAEAQG